MVRRIISTLLFIHLFYLDSGAQQVRSYRVNSVNGDSSGFRNSLYRYPNFAEGKVILKNKNVGSARLNYNRFSGQILFINSNGDTLEFATPNLIEYLTFANDTFFYLDKSFAQLVSHQTGIQLLKKETIEYNGKEKKGAYGNYSATTAANSINKVPDEVDLKKIGVDENALFVSSTHYYLKSVDGRFWPADKKSFRKLFPKDEMDEYLSKNKLNFANERDLLRLLDYLQH